MYACIRREAMVCLLSRVIRFFPYAIRSFYNNVISNGRTREDSKSICQMLCVRFFLRLKTHMRKKKKNSMYARILKLILNQVKRPSVRPFSIERSNVKKNNNLDFVAILHSSRCFIFPFSIEFVCIFSLHSLRFQMHISK